jgi:hypothetical protein
MQSRSVSVSSNSSSATRTLQITRNDDGTQTWSTVASGGLFIGADSGAWRYNPSTAILVFLPDSDGDSDVDPIMAFLNVSSDFMSTFCTRTYQGDGSLLGAGLVVRDDISWTIGEGCV